MYAHKADHEGIKNENNLPAIVVSGWVKDGESVGFNQGVNLIVKVTATGTISNNSRAHKISASDNNAVVVFSAVNYLTQEVQVNGKETIDIILQVKANSAVDKKVLRVLRNYGLGEICKTLNYNK